MIKFKTELKIIKAHPDAILPTQRIDDVGFDVYSVERTVIKPGKVGKIDIGIQFAKNPSYPKNLGCSKKNEGIIGIIHDSRWSIETKIEGRSGLASQGIFPVGGIIDPSYRNSIIVCLFNSTETDYVVEQGTKIAQLVLYPVLANTENHDVSFVFAEKDEQDQTERGKDGFGSTGIK